MTTIKNFRLKADQPFSSCDTLLPKCTGEVFKTAVDRVGELTLESGGTGTQPIEAFFYSPNKDDCIGDQAAKLCDFSATFSSNELAQLIADNKQLEQYRPQKSSKNDSPQFVAVPPTAGEQVEGGFFQGLANNLTNNVIPVSALALLLLAILGRKSIIRILGGGNSRQRRPQRERNDSVSFQTQGLNPIFNPSLESSSELNRQLLPIIQKIDLLATRLDSLETELTVISQRTQPSVSFSTPPAQQTPRPSQPVVTNSVPKPRPALDVDLIKLAVATSDYELIRTFPHEFVTETLESRQGMEDRLRFSIDGSQNQADQRSQSEFIAIAHLGAIYLIPNLLPNAADPARTIKRFVERNKLYRGSGERLLTISDLATVEKSGDCYVLLTSGRVG